RLWFLDQLQPGSVAYNIPFAVRFRGPLQTEALRQSLAEIARRHETLRTTFAVVGRQPAPAIGPPGGPPPALPDPGSAPPARRDAKVQAWLAAEPQRPFDLAAGPLWRVTLLRLAAEEHLALLTLHHSIADGWSVGVLLRELAVLYRAHAAGLPSPLPKLPVE